MDELVVLKFGGSSVADNDKLKLVAGRIKEFYKHEKKVVVVVSAQGKTTDRLIGEAKSLAKLPNERELDVLLSTGEQISISKLAILLNEIEIPAISLTGWQAGIYTNNINQNALIEEIDISRIINELQEGKVVIVAGFQGINCKGDITTLGRGGSDTTAVALAAKLNTKNCYIYSDVDGVYSTDPRQVKIAKKIPNISYSEMIDIANEGAKVLHPRCVELGRKYKIPIIAKSTFIENDGTIINGRFEETEVKNIVKNDNILFVNIIGNQNYEDLFNEVYQTFISYNLDVKNLVNSSENNFEISFTINSQGKEKIMKILNDEFRSLKYKITKISRISIIGNGITKNNIIIQSIMNIIEKNKLNILSMEINESKIAIMFKDIVYNNVLEEIHEALIK